MTMPRFEPAPEAPPDPDKVAKPAPGRTAAPRASSARSSSRSKASRPSLEREIGAMLVRMNMLLLITPFARDALDEYEIMALAKDINEQAQRSQRFYRMVETALNASSGGGLPVTVAIIAGRRLARHGALPLPPTVPLTQAQIDDALGSLIVMNAQGGKRPPTMPPVMQPDAGGSNGVGA